MSDTAFSEPKVCQEKGRLLLRYSDCIGTYNQAAKALTRLRPTSPRNVYQDLRDTLEQKRLDCEQARLEFDRHVSQHKC